MEDAAGGGTAALLKVGCEWNLSERLAFHRERVVLHLLDMKPKPEWFFFALATISMSGAAAQMTTPDSPVGKPPATVTVTFFAADSHGNPIQGLTSADVSIRENKKAPLSVGILRTAKQLPLRLGLLVDASGSQGAGLYEPAVKAAHEFLNQALTGPDDRVFIVTFSATLKATDFLTKGAVSNAQIDAIPRGGTALYDAIFFSCRDRFMKDPVQQARRVLVVLSDGDDNLSHVTRSQAIAEAEQAGALIFTVSTKGGQNRYSATGEQGDSTLKQFATESGGYSFSDLGPKDLPKAFATIKAQLDNMYSVTYIPADPGQAGHFQPIELKVTSDKKWKVHAPKGYIVSVVAQ
jgi:VWFA-related protein